MGRRNGSNEGGWGTWVKKTPREGRVVQRSA